MGTIKMAVPVPESVLKKRKTQEKLANEKAVATAETKKANKAKRAAAYKSAEKYVKEYRSLARARVRMHRQAKAAGNHYVEPEAKLMFVVRIRGLNDMHPKTKKILQIMRLRQINLGVFMKVSKAATQRQLGRGGWPRQARHHLHGGPCPRDRHRWATLHTGQQLPVAVQAPCREGGARQEAQGIL